MKQLEEQREEYVGDCPGNAAVEKCSGAAGMADKILEALKRLEEAALFLQDRVTGSVGTVEKMGEEFQTIKHKVSCSFVRKYFPKACRDRRIIWCAGGIHDVKFSSDHFGSS